KRGEAPHRLRARVEGTKCSLEVLERRLGGATRQPGTGERSLHTSVRRDDRAAQVGIVPEIVERLVERDRQRVLAAEAPRAGRLLRTARGKHDERGTPEQRHDDRDLVPAKARVARVLRSLGDRALRLARRVVSELLLEPP